MGDYDDYDAFAEEEKDFENYEIEDEGPQLEMEAKAFERAGPSGKLSELLQGVFDPNQKKGRENISPEDRFLITTDAMCRKINAENVVVISQNDINNMLEKTTLINGLKYKNPTAYILGYLATKGGTVLTKESVTSVIKRVLPLVSDNGVEAPDVIRYARFWKNFL